MITRADLVAAFPEFASTDTYPDSTVNFWIAQADNVVTQDVFQTSYTLASALYVAHNIALGAKNVAGAAKGSVGDVNGPVTSKSVGSVSKSMDIGSVTNQGAAFWNATSYGVRFFQLVKGFSTGPRYATGYPQNAPYPGVAYGYPLPGFLPPF